MSSNVYLNFTSPRLLATSRLSSSQHDSYKQQVRCSTPHSHRHQPTRHYESNETKSAGARFQVTGGSTFERIAWLTASSSKMPAQVDENKTSFLDLPAELRNEIYRLCLLAPEATHFVELQRIRLYRIRKQYTTIRTSQKLRALGLLRSCKQINQEATSIFYGENAFRFKDAKAAQAFLPRIAHSMGQIRDISVGLGDQTKTSFARLLITLKSAVRLRSLTLRFGMNGRGLEIYNDQEAAKALGPLTRFLWKQRKPAEKIEVLRIVCWRAGQWLGDARQQKYDNAAADYEARVRAILEKTLK